jgi:membrane protein YdbS with pleckstrin-like domain
MRKDLVPGEQVIVTTRPQPRTLIAPAAAFIAAPAAAAFASAWISRGEAERLVPILSADWSPWLVAGCILGVAWIWLAYCLPRLLKWQGTRYTLTSRRIVARYGMLKRRDQQVNLAAVRNLVLTQSMVQRILRSGNISLDTGYQGTVTFADVPEAVRFRDFILDAIDEMPGDMESGAGYSADDSGGTMPWELREGGTDER